MGKHSRYWENKLIPEVQFLIATKVPIGNVTSKCTYEGSPSVQNGGMET